MAAITANGASRDRIEALVPLRNCASRSGLDEMRQSYLSHTRTSAQHRLFHRQDTVNMALSERSHLVNGFKRDRSTPSRERRAQEASI